MLQTYSLTLFSGGSRWFLTSSGKPVVEISLASQEVVPQSGPLLQMGRPLLTAAC